MKILCVVVQRSVVIGPVDTRETRGGRASVFRPGAHNFGLEARSPSATPLQRRLAMRNPTPCSRTVENAQVAVYLVDEDHRLRACSAEVTTGAGKFRADALAEACRFNR